jgi:hypothetical protein
VWVGVLVGEGQGVVNEWSAELVVIVPQGLVVHTAAVALSSKAHMYLQPQSQLAHTLTNTIAMGSLGSGASRYPISRQ